MHSNLIDHINHLNSFSPEEVAQTYKATPKDDTPEPSRKTVDAMRWWLLLDYINSLREAE